MTAVADINELAIPKKGEKRMQMTNHEGRTSNRGRKENRGCTARDRRNGICCQHHFCIWSKATHSSVTISCNIPEDWKVLTKCQLNADKHNTNDAKGSISNDWNSSDYTPSGNINFRDVI